MKHKRRARDDSFIDILHNKNEEENVSADFDSVYHNTLPPNAEDSPPTQSIHSTEQIDQKYLYWNLDSIKKWSDINFSAQCIIYDICLNNITTLLGSADWIALIRKRNITSFISLGVGIGRKDNIILENLCKNTNDHNIRYLPVKNSTLMIEDTIRPLGKFLLRNSEKVQLIPIQGELTILNVHKQLLKSNFGNLYTLLGSNIGDFKEEEVLNSLCSVMSTQDLLIIGVEWISDHITDNHDNSINNQFNRQSVHSAKSGMLNDWDSRFRRRIITNYSDVNSSKTIVQEYNDPKAGYIRLSESTKYKRSNFIEHLKRFRLEKLIEIENQEGNYSSIVFEKVE